MKNSIIDVLIDHLIDEAVELYSSELVKEEKYKKLDGKHYEVFEELCEKYPQIQEQLTQLQDLQTNIDWLELKFIYRKGVEDGIKLYKTFNFKG